MNLFRLTILMSSMVFWTQYTYGKTAPHRAFKQILPELATSANKQVNKTINHAIQGHSYGLNPETQKNQNLEAVASTYIDDFLNGQNFNKSADTQFKQVSIHHGVAMTTVRFKQYHAGVEVYGGQFSVSMNQSGIVKYASHKVYEVSNQVQSKNTLNEKQAVVLADKYFNYQLMRSDKTNVKTVLYPSTHGMMMVYVVEYFFNENSGHWQLLIDADSGVVVRAEDKLFYASAQVNVFDPDPLTTSGQSYGGGYVDGDDSNTVELEQELKTYTIDLMVQDNAYVLEGEWAEMVDESGPFEGVYSQASPDFRYNREDNQFEAINTYYHISHFLNYINNGLGINVRPYQYNTGIKFDAHGNNNLDSSFYLSSGLLVFGEGCVDDGEDADVIIHELGHGIHDWVTRGNASNVEGVGEGIGDYFAQSYSRTRNDYEWTENDQQYNDVFSWDGHNECWSGRTTNYKSSYPSGLTGQIHTDGQILSTCLMKVWDELGHEKTDSMVIEGLSLTGSYDTQNEVVQALLVAAEGLGYQSDINFIANTFLGCGYDIEQLHQFPVSISHSASSMKVGDTLQFTARMDGGTPPISYKWDINGDGEIDGTSQSINVSYSEAYTGEITVKVYDAYYSGGSATLDIDVESPDVQITQDIQTRENLEQVCGNGDDVIDPGERWSVPLTIANKGTLKAENTYLALAKKRLSVNEINDDYGNFSHTCQRDFIDISETGTKKDWVSAGVLDYPADDEGYVNINLNTAFDHYGESVNQMVASTNGYFNTNIDSKGDAWDNDCPLPASPDRDWTGSRIAPMHDDMKSADFYHQYFSICPRPAETGTDLSCEVFLWKGAALWESENSNEEIDIQAILYPATSQWVFQYAGSGFDGSTSTTGMQNRYASDGLTFACNSPGTINTNDAVCVYNKNNLPKINGVDFVMLETPVVKLGDLKASQSVIKNMNFSVAEDAECGTDFTIYHEASVFDAGFNKGQANLLDASIGNNGSCQLVTHCGVGSAVDDYKSNDIEVKNGLWWNPDRAGNGIDLHEMSQNALLYVMYTANPNRTPVWYIANDSDSSYNQYYNDVTEVSYPGGFFANDQKLEKVGWSNTTFLDATHAIQVRNIKGHLSAEKIILDQFAADLTPKMHTGHYYSPNEAGWGQSVVTLGDVRVVISYIYDEQGQPFWTIASGANDASEKTVVYADTFCPHCPAVSMDIENVGTMRMNFDGQKSGDILEYIISYPPQSGEPVATWESRGLPIINVVPEQN